MQLVQLFVQIEAAHDTVDELGRLNLIEFRNVSFSYFLLVVRSTLSFFLSSIPDGMMSERIRLNPVVFLFIILPVFFNARFFSLSTCLAARAQAR